MDVVTEPAPIRRARSVGGEVAAWIEQLIDDGLQPGDRLPTERDIAARLDVSRTSVREALRVLEDKRRVDRRPGRGTVVLGPEAGGHGVRDGLGPQERERADVAELRLVLEPQVAALAAARAVEPDLVRLEQVIADSHAGLSPAESLALDLRFHRLVAEAGGNPLLVELCTLASEWTTEVRRRSHATRAGRRSSVDGHRRILAAVAAHDAAAAEAAMRAHLGDVAALVETGGRAR